MEKYVNDLDRGYECLVNKGLQNLSQPEKLILLEPTIGKSGGRKTVISNYSTLCKQAKIDPMHLSKFFAVETGSIINYDINNEQLTIVGTYRSNQIKSIIRNYSQLYVICKVCHHAKTSLLREDRILFVDCSDCKSRTPIEDIKAGFSAKL